MFAAAETHTPSTVLGAQRLVVEVPRALVPPFGLQQVDQRERVQQVAVAEDEVLVVLDPALAR
jgi:hypothetical protein